MISGVRVRRIFDELETSFSTDSFDGRLQPTTRPVAQSVDAFHRRAISVIKADIDKLRMKQEAP